MAMAIGLTTVRLATRRDLHSWAESWSLMESVNPGLEQAGRVTSRPAVNSGEMRTFSAVIFDMDGVIVDSEPLHERAFRDIFAEMGYGANHDINFTEYYGKSDRDLWLDFMGKHQPPQTLEELLRWKQGRFLEILRERRPIFPGMAGLLKRMADRYKLGLASGSLHADIDVVLEMGDLRRFFPVIVSGQDVARGKPAPDVFLRVADLLGVRPEMCCVIEDSAAGVKAARSAGMTVIAITNTLPADKLAGADHVVATSDEIESLLLRPIASRSKP